MLHFLVQLGVIFDSSCATAAQAATITRNLRYVISEFCRFSCRWLCPQGRAEQYITFFSMQYNFLIVHFLGVYLGR
jgi:hypothetical protein